MRTLNLKPKLPLTGNINIDVEIAHRYSIDNKEDILNTTKAGCFYCCNTFSVRIITEWADRGRTALCPYCGIDSVIPYNEIFPNTKEFLLAMRGVWFNAGDRL